MQPKRHNNSIHAKNSTPFDKLCPRDQQRLLDWILENLVPEQYFHENITSGFLLKKFTETNFDVLDEVFKSAMLISGFSVLDEKASDWVFNVSLNSTLFETQTHMVSTPYKV